MSFQDIGLLSLTEIIGDYGFKQFANNGGINNFAIGIFGYIGVIWFLIRSLQGSTILLVNNAWDGMSTLIESLFAFFILNERLDDITQYFGIVFIIVGLFLLKLPLKRTRSFVFPVFMQKERK
jgi:multidrug transporter EmrE-like cation transporter